MIRRVSRRAFMKGVGLGVAVLARPAWLDSVLALPADAPLPSREDMDRILRAALSRGGDFADLYLETRIQTEISIAESEVRSMEYGILRGGGVRTVAGERTGYAFAESHDPAALAQVAASAAQIAAGSAPRLPADAGELRAGGIVKAERSITGMPVADKLAILERADRAARAVGPQITQVSITYSDSDQEFTVVSSNGLLVTDRLPMIYLRVNVTAARNGATSEGMVRLSARRGMELLEGQAPEKAGREAAEQALRMLDAQPAPTGEMAVVVAAGGGVMFHEAVGHGIEADGVLRHASAFAGRLGEKVASDLVSLVDDSSIPAERGSFNVDDEGCAPGRTVLIERGILKRYMQDQRTARLMNAERTANGRRMSFRNPPIVRMTNTNLLPGSQAPEEIIKETRRGIYAVSFGGGEVDITSGQFTFGLREAYLIEDGKVTAPIKGANLVGSGPQVLLGIDRVGSDFETWPGTCGKDGQWVPVTSGCPTLRIAKLTVGGTAGVGGSL